MIWDLEKANLLGSTTGKIHTFTKEGLDQATATSDWFRKMSKFLASSTFDHSLDAPSMIKWNQEPKFIRPLFKYEAS